MKLIKIENRKIGDGQPAFIVAEMSGNHLQRFDLAVKTIHAMKEAGADAVKLQTYTADTISFDSNNKYFQIHQGTIWDGTTLHKLYEKAFMPWDWQPKLKKVAHDLDMPLFSSPFDKTAVDFLEKMKVPVYKIASPEITDLPLIEYIAQKGKPMFISTGIARLNDIKEAINACKRKKNLQIILLKCTTAYPAPLSEVNLKTMVGMGKKFHTIIGLSDHTMSLATSIAAAALGAKVIEKHFILDRKLGGPDAKFSLEPQEFKQMVQGIRDTEQAIGKVSYNLSPTARKSREFCRSLFVVADMAKNDIFTTKNVRSIRPGFGLAPKYLPKILGKRACRNIKKGTPLAWSHAA